MLGLALGFYPHGGVVAKVEEPRWVEVVAASRSNNHKGVAVDDRAGEHALALLARLTARGVELDSRHASRLPAPLAKGDGQTSLVEHIHGLQDEIARHGRNSTARRYACEGSI